MKRILICLFFILNICIIHSQTTQTCGLKLARNLNDLYRGNSVYDSGVVDALWQKSSVSFYTAEYSSKIDYLFLMETKTTEHDDTIVS